MRVSLLKRAVLLGVMFVAVSSFAMAQNVFNYGGPPIDTAPVDDLYDGTLGSMACASLDNSGGTVVNIVGGFAMDMEMTHTWIGDLTIKVVSPTGTVTTAMSRPLFVETGDDGTGCCGDSSDLDGVPINFANGNPFDAEAMGTGDPVCTGDGECAFSPNPDTGPGSDFSDFDGETAIGTWMVCVGDAAAGDTGVLNDFTITVDGDIPVEMTSFTSQVIGTSLSLNWETASETNNAGFEVQLRNGEDWNALGWVAGHGTTTEAQIYTFSVGEMPVGSHTFRLKQIDFDGAFEYSDEVEATIETPGTHQLSSAYPNPFNPQSNFTLAVAQEQHVTAELFNTLGQRIAVLFNGTVEANQPQTITIDGAGLASGMYVVRVNGNSFRDALNVTLLK